MGLTAAPPYVSAAPDQAQPCCIAYQGGSDDRRTGFRPRVAPSSRAVVATLLDAISSRPGHHFLSLDEHHEKRMSIEMKDISVNRAYVTDRLIALVDRCMQAVPVLNKRGNATGQHKFEPNGAVKALELLGLEQGMFARQHKHLHVKTNPLDGNRNEIIGRLGVLMFQLSDRDLEGLGLRRITAAEAV